MYPLVSRIFDTSGFPARWQCGSWSTAHGMTHIISDFAIAGAYATIPVSLAYFVLRRRDIPFLPVFWLFAAFIFFCGLGHFIEAFIFWHPLYRFSAAVKICTATASWATVIALIRILPQALELPGLAVLNERLKSEIRERTLAETRIQESYDELEQFSNNVVDREERMIELKSEVNSLLLELGRKARY